MAMPAVKPIAAAAAFSAVLSSLTTTVVDVVAGAVAGKVEWLVPEKYSRPETSGLTAQVEDKNNEIDFDIPAGK